MARSGFTLPPEVRPIMISKANFELLLREGRSFEEYFRFEEEAAVKEREAAVLDRKEEPEESSEESEPSEPSEPSEESEPETPEEHPEAP